MNIPSETSANQQIFTQGMTVAVVVPSAARGPYDYRVGANLGQGVSIGDLVRIPFGRREVTGVVIAPGSGTVPEAKLKDILNVVGEGVDDIQTVSHPNPPPSYTSPTSWGRKEEERGRGQTTLSSDFVSFLMWVSEYTLSDLSAVFKLALPIDLGERQPKENKRGKPIAGTMPNPDHKKFTLSPEQQTAADDIVGSVTRGAYDAIVLDGVTGAGKTEVYFEGIAAAIRAGRQVVVLLPEIALTAAFVERFTARFGQAPGIWHSHMTPAQRRKTYMGILSGEIKVIAGARSALMLPYPNLGLIVIDEEHDASYKQEEGVLYHARDMAVARAYRQKIPVILASATPSLETMANVWNGRYRTIKLPDRFGGATMPDIQLIDLKIDKPDKGQFISPKLYGAITDTLQRGEQVLLFLNRRGYAPLTLCRGCGHRFTCPRCTAWMVAHRRTGSLHCHHCGYETRVPKHCPSCNAEDSLVLCGPGVERIEEEVKSHYPDARTMIFSSDLANDPKLLTEWVAQIESGKIDIVIGTQMIAKGHHFPGLTLVGVIDSDLGLSGGDLRAAERTFQLLQQVSGRAGRAEKSGRVFLQTFMPDNKVMQALRANARDQFLAVESDERRAATMPPYGRLAGVIISGKDEGQTKTFAQDLLRAAPSTIVPGMKIWGPAEAPMYRLRGKFRFRFLVQSERSVPPQKTIADWIASVPAPSSIDVRVDIDPQSFV